MPIPNPPIFSDNVTPPAPGQVLRLNAAGDGWEPVTITAAALAVPQAAIAQVAAAAALTAATVATADGSDPATTQALANALKTAVNALIADNVAQRNQVVALTTKLNTALTELATAGILTP